MIALDLRTVILSHVLTDAVCLLVVLSLWRQDRRRFAGTGLLALDFALQTVAVLLIALRGRIPDGLSMVAGSTLVVAGALCGYLGLLRFVGQRRAQLHNVVLLAVFAAVHAYFALGRPSLTARNVNLSLALFVVCGQCAWLLLHAVAPGLRRVTRGVGLIFAAYCLVSVVRVVEAAVGRPRAPDFFQSGGVDALAMVAYQMLFILLTYGLVLMFNQRLLQEVRRQEAKYTTLFQSAPHAVVVTRRSDDRIMEVNDGFAKLTGHRAGEVVGRPVAALRLFARAEDRAALDLELTARGSVHAREILLERASGERVTGLLSADTVPIDEEGFVLWSISDVTGLKRAEQRLQELAAQATAANRAKSAFLASMSHELRTPLNAILGFSSLMRHDAALSAEQRRTLDIINRSGDHLLRLIDHVLDMATIEAGHAAVADAPFDPPAMLREIADLMRPQAEARGLHLELELGAGLPRVVSGDAGKLRQVIVNLVGNAVKFTPRGAVTVRADGRPAADGERLELLVEVADQGAGIPAADRQRVFEPFVQLGQRGDGEGTGLGLAIARQLVQLMGGVIAVEDAPGGGSTFRVALPVAPTAAAATPPADGPAAPLPRLASGQAEYRVLVVDDRLESRELLRRLLEHAGFRVRGAADGAAGVEAFQAWRPHLIWMDWRMPVMDGLEATRRIRALEGGRDVKIVALSASVLAEERAQVLTAGADDFVAKPAPFAVVFDCLARHLGAHFTSAGLPPATVGAPEPDLDREALAALPAPLRAELAAALVNLDAARIGDLIDRMVALAPAAGGALRRLAAELRYSEILSALQRCEASSSAPGLPT